MNIKQFALTAAISLVALGAHAVTVGAVTGTVDDTLGATPLALDSTNVSGGLLTQSSITGYAVMPGLNAAGAYFLAGEPDASGGAAVLTLVPNVNFVSFDWGTPDINNVNVENELLVKLSDNSTVSFLASTLSLTQGVDRYVNFSVGSGLYITQMTFESINGPAFEAANFSVNVVPEPANAMLLLAGLGLVGMMARRRKA